MASQRHLKTIPILVVAGGVTMMAVLVGYFGATSVMRALLAIGWVGFVAVCLIHLVVIALEGVAWRVLVPGARAWVFIWGRLLRDAGSEVLPISQMGGCVLGARAIVLAGVPAATAAASTMVDLTLEFLAKLAYMALGLFLLTILRPDTPVGLPVVAGLAATGLLAIAFVILQRRGFALFDRFARLLGRGWAERTSAGAAAVHATLARIYWHQAGLYAGFALHLVCWISSAVEVWLVLRLAGVPRGFLIVLVIESLLYAVRTLAFAIPNAVGVQEGAYVLIGAAFGLTPGMALAISLLKRARDLVIGLPALGIWQAAEGGRLWRRRAPRSRPATAAERSCEPAPGEPRL